MNRRSRFLSTVAFATLTAASLHAPAAWAGADEATLCVPLHARIVAAFSSGPCDSPVGMCTEGTISSLFGYVTAATRFVASGLGGEPVGEVSIVTPPAEPASTWSCSGELTIQTHLGDLVLLDVGVLDTARGTFVELDRVVGGTGLFVEASGDVFIYGVLTPDGAGFDGDVRGEVCIPYGG